MHKNSNFDLPESFDLYYYFRDGSGAITQLVKTRAATSTGVTAAFEIAAQYTYDPYGDLEAIIDTNGSGLCYINPLRYKDYIYDTETGFYYVSSRYYDPEIGRWINADAFVSTGQSILSTNMFAYCENNPVNRIDFTGYAHIEHFGGGGISTANPYGLAEAIYRGLAIALGLAQATVSVSVGMETATLRKEMFDVHAKAKEKAETITIPAEPDSPVIFPVDPNAFNPVGLTKVPRTGTKNGTLISWMDPLTNTEVFRWDENPNYPNGSHYHIHKTGHYYPGMLVPEPYATIYFPFR